MKRKTTSIKIAVTPEHEAAEKARAARLEQSPRIEKIDRAISFLSDARDLFRRVGCNKAADACARALKSAGGALRHAERMESEAAR